MMPRRVLIVEDVTAAMAWLTGIVMSAFPGCAVDQARSVKGVEALGTGDWDMALVDLGLPDGSGLDVIRHLKAVLPDLTCIVSTVLGDDAHIVAALSAGAQGYILKGQPEIVVRRQLMQLQHGVPALSPTIARRIMEHFQRTGPVDSDAEALSARETEVLVLLTKGLRNGEVAQALGLAESTIATHVKSIYRKLGISSRAEAALHAARLGLA